MRTRDKMWCSHCVEIIKVREECGGKFISCSLCGKLLDCAEFKRLRMVGKLKKSQVAPYLHNGKERCLEKIIWEEMHNLYLQANLDNSFEELISAKELAKWVDVVLDLLGNSRKEKKHEHPIDNKSSTSTKSRNHKLKRKSFSSEINYEAFERLYKENTKKQRTASEVGECESDELKGIEETHKESEAAAVNNG